MLMKLILNIIFVNICYLYMIIYHFILLNQNKNLMTKSFVFFYQNIYLSKDFLFIYYNVYTAIYKNNLIILSLYILLMQEFEVMILELMRDRYFHFMRRLLTTCTINIYVDV